MLLRVGVCGIAQGREETPAGIEGTTNIMLQAITTIIMEVTVGDSMEEDTTDDQAEVIIKVDTAEIIGGDTGKAMHTKSTTQIT